MSSWKSVILSQGDTMNTAINVLNSTAMGILLVSDEAGRLLGTITDGDIRRALLCHKSMDASVVGIMSKDPTTATSGYDNNKILELMKSKKLDHMPVVDDDSKIIGLETLHHLLKNKQHDNPVFLMAGGFGSRLQPLTNDTPKPLLHVGSKPILETILEQFIEAGFHDFYISTHYKSEMVRNHFGDGKQWGVSIQYIHEEKPLGTAGALGLLPEDVSKLPIIMMNGDILTKVSFTHLLDFHADYDGIATMCIREYDFEVPYGVVQTDGTQVTSIVEKPVHKFFVNAGIYVIDPSLINMVDVNIYLDMPNLLEEQIEKGKKVNMFPVHEYWLDIGRIDEFERANREISVEF